MPETELHLTERFHYILRMLDELPEEEPEEEDALPSPPPTEHSVADEAVERLSADGMPPTVAATLADHEAPVASVPEALQTGYRETEIVEGQDTQIVETVQPPTAPATLEEGPKAAEIPIVTEGTEDRPAELASVAKVFRLPKSDSCEMVLGGEEAIVVGATCSCENPTHYCDTCETEHCAVCTTTKHRLHDTAPFSEWDTLCTCKQPAAQYCGTCDQDFCDNCASGHEGHDTGPQEDWDG
eukprot:TRINITY_DN12237_c0_g1_i1.p1 TRINITY_DN12237_c0_g1~~TRINITY_DN12237_c0_g1_i1.p1  ORF type:complete len:252 (+),score=63.75 TRINITY_DN12237_c0_g1_i1:35-757(+)